MSSTPEASPEEGETSRAQLQHLWASVAATTKSDVRRGAFFVSVVASFPVTGSSLLWGQMSAVAVEAEQRAAAARSLLLKIL